jgi:hypothetical protein
VAFEYGWKKLTASFWPMLKELKLTTARSSAVMFKVEASGLEKEALPDSTCQPSGKAKILVAEDRTIDNINIIKKRKFLFKILLSLFILSPNKKPRFRILPETGQSIKKPILFSERAHKLDFGNWLPFPE